MPHLSWSPRAQADVIRLDQFLSERSPKAAVRAMEAIRDGVRVLQRFPHAGRPADQVREGHRELPVRVGRSGYMVLYRVTDEAVVIAAIRHQREAGYEP